MRTQGAGASNVWGHSILWRDVANFLENLSDLLPPPPVLCLHAGHEIGCLLGAGPRAGSVSVEPLLFLGYASSRYRYAPRLRIGVTRSGPCQARARRQIGAH